MVVVQIQELLQVEVVVEQVLLVLINLVIRVLQVVLV
tara:strand:- start:103 stop:213 length:111 start_codon:yes stop_codon:yes gene_type:complete